PSATSAAGTARAVRSPGAAPAPHAVNPAHPAALPARRHLPVQPAGTPVLDVTIPVHNEERDLERCVRRLREHLARTFPYGFRITVADNASTDSTPLISARLEGEIPEARAFRQEEEG